MNHALATRKILVIGLGLMTALGLSSCSKLSSKATPTLTDKAGDEAVIYGRDSRVEVASVTSLGVQQLSTLSVALIMGNRLKTIDAQTVEVVGETLKDSENLCSSEKFVEQRVSAFCSGILIDSKHVLTAGHCIFSQKDCTDTKFVFGYEYVPGSMLNYRIPNKDVYSCAKIVSAARNPEKISESEMGFDFAIVELDRAVPGQFQVTINVNDNLKRGDVLFTLGYPVGLPKKFADGKVSSNSLNNLYFRASMDTYGGNSGSPVFNASTGSLEGILVSGEDDFSPSAGQNCNVSHKCLQGNCGGEQVLKMSKIKRYLSN